MLSGVCHSVQPALTAACALSVAISVYDHTEYWPNICSKCAYVSDARPYGCCDMAVIIHERLATVICFCLRISALVLNYEVSSIRYGVPWRQSHRRSGLSTLPSLAAIP